MKKNEEKTLTYDKTEMVNKFKSYYNIISVFGGIIFGGVVASILALFFVGGSIFFRGTSNEDVKDIEVEIVDNEETSSKYDKIMLEGFKDILQNVEKNNPEKVEQFKNLFEVLSILVMFINLYLLFLIVLRIALVFKNTAENETPFTKNNVKNINKIKIDTLLLAILSLSGWLFVLVIYSLSYIFKAGYELQKESDELL